MKRKSGHKKLASERRAKKSKGLLTQQELSAKARVRRREGFCVYCREDCGHVPDTMTRQAARPQRGYVCKFVCA